MPKRIRSELESDNINSLFDLISDTSNLVDPSLDFNENLTAIKKRLLTKDENKAATDFTLVEAISTFGLKYVQTPKQYYHHDWDIEKDVGTEEIQMTPCIGETLMSSCI